MISVIKKIVKAFCGIVLWCLICRMLYCEGNKIWNAAVVILAAGISVFALMPGVLKKLTADLETLILYVAKWEPTQIQMIFVAGCIVIFVITIIYGKHRSEKNSFAGANTALEWKEHNRLLPFHQERYAYEANGYFHIERGLIKRRREHLHLYDYEISDDNTFIQRMLGLRTVVLVNRFTAKRYVIKNVKCSSVEQLLRMTK